MYYLDPDETENKRAVLMSKTRTRRELNLNRGYIFHSDAFWSLHLTLAQLMISHRQETNIEFYEMLRKLRGGLQGPDASEVCRYFNKRCLDWDTDRPGGVKPVCLYPKIVQVNAENNKSLEALPGKATAFNAKD